MVKLQLVNVFISILESLKRGIESSFKWGMAYAKRYHWVYPVSCVSGL